MTLQNVLTQEQFAHNGVKYALMWLNSAAEYHLSFLLHLPFGRPWPARADETFILQSELEKRTEHFVTENSLGNNGVIFHPRAPRVLYTKHHGVSTVFHIIKASNNSVDRWIQKKYVKPRYLEFWHWCTCVKCVPRNRSALCSLKTRFGLI